MRKARSFLATISRFLFVLVVLASIFLYAMFQGGIVSWTVFYMLAPFIVYSIALFFYPLSKLTAERIIRTPVVRNGGKLVVSVTVKRKFRFPLLYMVATEKILNSNIAFLAGGKTKHFFVFGFHKTVNWEYEIEGMPRGEHILEGVEIELSDFFGWIRKTHFIPIKNTVLVYPRITDIHYIPTDTQYDRGTTVSPFNIMKDTTMATGIRDYQSGDRVTWIHWKSFARTQTLMTKEFEDRRSQELILILDGRPSEVFEEQVEFAASILKEASSHQAGIGLAITGPKQFSFPLIQSEEHLQRAFLHLAKVKPSGDSSTVMASSYGSELQHSNSIILITGSPDWSFIQSVVQNAKSARSITCFTVLKQDAGTQKKLVEDVRIAKSRGITVKTLTQKQFPEAFKEVIRS